MLNFLRNISYVQPTVFSKGNINHIQRHIFVFCTTIISFKINHILKGINQEEYIFPAQLSFSYAPDDLS